MGAIIGTNGRWQGNSRSAGINQIKNKKEIFIRFQGNGAK
jgi:hypothetical protein